MKQHFPLPVKLAVVLLMAMALHACKTSNGIFGKKTPHEQYGDKLSGAGLSETALGRAWFEAAERSLSNPLGINIPYREAGYFSADRPQAMGLRFQGKRGEKLTISLTKRPAAGFNIYLELWKAAEAAGQKPRLIAAMDTTGADIIHEVDDPAVYVIRLQPELLKAGEYTLSISAGPSLAYPIKAPGKNHTQSFWGADRDAGARRHEGIDMFAPRLTPVVAAADGRVTRVNENNLGGKVVWMRPNGRNFTLYYAHLDQQLVSDGQSVKTGDTLGLMGNTGNAKHTAPHLHFGIYTSGGAVDPFPFVNPVIKSPAGITAPVKNLGKVVRTDAKNVKLFAEQGSEPLATLDQHTLLQVEAATADWYKVSLPNGLHGLVKSTATDEPALIRKQTIKEELPVYDMPDSLAARKTVIKAGDAVSILAAFDNYYYVRTGNEVTGWIRK
jgi:peptidoglycan LD-endopeptidase LytH